MITKYNLLIRACYLGGLLFVSNFMISQTIPCQTDTVFKKEFFSHIGTVQKWELGSHEFIKNEDYYNSLVFLSKRTGIVSKADMGGRIHYLSPDDFYTDLYLWLKWYDGHACK